MPDMKAVVLTSPGGPEALRIERRPIPAPAAGQVLIRVRAFGLNRSELFTRQGHSPSVKLPRVLGIEAAGEIISAPGGEFAPGTKVMTAMGGMGREFDGGYAEYVSVPAGQVVGFRTSLPWEVVGALPEMIQTAWGSLFTALDLARDDKLLIRGGTTSVGLAACALAKRHGAFVAATTRTPGNRALVESAGCDAVLLDDGRLETTVARDHPGGFDKVLELVGIPTLRDSLRCVRPRGVVCMTGTVGNAWSIEDFEPMAVIPKAVHLTTYGGSAQDLVATPMQELLDEIEDGRLGIRVGRVFRLDDIVEAHRCMEANGAGGKLVVVTDA